MLTTQTLAAPALGISPGVAPSIAWAAIDTAIAISAVSVIAVLVVAIALYSRRLARSLHEVKLAAIHAYGLIDREPKALFPDLEGRVDGFEVRVDVIFLSHSTGGENGNIRRPYTRVRVPLGFDPGLSVRLRGRAEVSPRHPERATGDAVFDRKFVLFADPSTDLATALPPGARQAFVNARHPPVLEAGVLVWTHLKHVRDPETLLAAIDAAFSVARELAPDRASF